MNEHASGASDLRVSIIIVNWNGGELLRRSVESITRFPPRIRFEIVVVDNASSDDSLEFLKDGSRTWPGLRLIENVDNVGFSRANNQGIAQSSGPFVLLLNPDTEVTRGAIDTLIETVESSADVGACGPRLVNSDGSLQHSAWRNPPPAWQILVSGCGLWRLIPRRRRGDLLLGGHWDHSQRRAVPMLFGAALLVKRSVIDSIGGLDERFHMYAEDNEWCLRMTRAGWRIMFEPAAVVVHHGGRLASRRWTDLERLRVKVRAQLEFQRISMPRVRVLANLAAACTAAGIQRAWRMLRGRDDDEARIIFELHAADLKRAFRNASAGNGSSHR
jgi:GT2 family glycosyltransferase